MRISDWSSDLCSSDLSRPCTRARTAMCTGLPIGVACRQTPVAATICRLSVARYRSCARFLARFPAACGPGCGLASHDANEAFGVRCDASWSAETIAHQAVGHRPTERREGKECV